MPELPDVEVFRKYIDATALHQNIDRVHVCDEKILKDISARRLERHLRGQAFNGSRRHGKYIQIQLTSGWWLAMHFGMTGFVQYYKKEKRRPSQERLRIDFTNHYHLSLGDSRNMGGVYLFPNDRTLIREKQLGPDVLSAEVDLQRFRDLLHESNASVKSVLTDQKKMAGIGNVYADEILFQARIKPQTPANLIKPGNQEKLHRVVGQVMRAAIAAHADIDQMPEAFFLQHRRQNHPCPRCGTAIRRIALHGQSTYYCPKCQADG